VRVLAILQARMTSSRLPGKVLMDIDGMPMIARQIERLRQANLLDELVVATSTDSSDDVLADYIEGIGVNVQRGSLDNVLQRFVEVLDKYETDAVVRLTADCPLVDSEVLDGVVDSFLNSKMDYVSNTLERTFPRGLDVEVFKPEVLREVSRNDFRPMAKEHVTYGIYTRSDLYSVANVSQDPSFANLRWTVDTQLDLDFVRSVYSHLHSINKSFRQREILEWLEDFPEFAHYEIGDES
jgi:spore coat polysaccharide biosynthesis protein SpsF